MESREQARQTKIVLGLSLAIAATRLLALSRSMWDWDEALFTIGVRAYDVPSHHPHPPGYPLFMLAAKMVRLIVHDDFRAVQTIVVIASMLLFPALYALARALGFSFHAAAGGAALCAFFPNTWYYGGTALSDVPSLVLVSCASALLLRGRDRRGAYLAGALVLGIAAGFRPQNLFIGFAPAATATWYAIRRRAWRDVIAATAIGGAVVVASYAGAALASSSWRAYLDICAVQSRYLRATDSFLNPQRPSLVSLMRPVFIDPMHAGHFDLLLTALAGIGFILGVRNTAVRTLVAMFLPIQIFTWLMLDMSAFSRYSVAFVPMYAMLIAFALEALRLFATVAVVGLIARLIVWTVPALNEVRTTDSPVAAAVHALRGLPPSQTIYAHSGVGPFVTALLPDRRIVFVDSDAELPLTDAPYVREGATIAPNARTFRRSRRGHLATFVRPHYFEMTIMHAGDGALFRDGWYEEETDGETAWRWMQGRGSMSLPPIGKGARLTLSFRVHESAPLLTLQLNGREIDRGRCTTETVTKQWDVDARPDARNDLVLTIAPVFNPAREHVSSDPRDLGLQLLSWKWEPR